MAAPTGTPTPVVTTSPGYRPRSSAFPSGVYFHLYDGNYYFSSRGQGLQRGEGVITLTATNSAGTAKTTVSYAMDCYSSDATIANWLKGSAWEPVSWSRSQRRYIGGSSNHWFSRAVFNDNGNGLTVRTRWDYEAKKHVDRTERLTGGIRQDGCTQIKGTGWAFWWDYIYADDEEVVEGEDFQCDGQGGARGLFSLQRIGVPPQTDPSLERPPLNSWVRPVACSDDSPAGAP